MKASLRFLKLPSIDELTSKYFEKFGENVEFLDISGLRIRKLPSFIFENLPKLKWLDLRLMFINILILNLFKNSPALLNRKCDHSSHFRDNSLVDLPISMTGHRCLEVLLLDNNLFTELPTFLCTLTRLRVIGIRENLLDFPK